MSLFALSGGFMGGIGLFLLGMWLMTEGLKMAAGRALEHILGTWTRSRLRGLLAGFLVTGLVQSSSAVTVATLGFVNAGLLAFTQAIWVIFGSNVGTTVTGWLVALVGFDININAFALPFLGIGMFLRLSGEGSRRGAAGTALAGFGTLFLGIDVLKNTFAGLGSVTPIMGLGSGPLATVSYMLAGVLLTTLTQSSSAAMAMILTASAGGLLTLTPAAAVVIGANIGTTVTALIAAIGATSNARRAAGAHVLFNVITAMVALLILPWLLTLVGGVERILDLATSPVVTLALFHTVFNLLGVLLMWPLSDRLVRFLSARFRTAEEDEARPRHLDDNVLAVPTLALDALRLELKRMGGIALRMAATCLSHPAPQSLARDKRIVDQLNLASARFAARLYRSSMVRETAELLPQTLRLARYYDAVADLAERIDAQYSSQEPPSDPVLREALERLAQTSSRLFSLSDTSAADFDLDHCNRMQDEFELVYQETKSTLLSAGAGDRLEVAHMEGLLQAISDLHRAAAQAVKAARLFVDLERWKSSRISPDSEESALGEDSNSGT